jgi:hypothetical protein
MLHKPSVKTRSPECRQAVGESTSNNVDLALDILQLSHGPTLVSSRVDPELIKCLIYRSPLGNGPAQLRVKADGLGKNLAKAGAANERVGLEGILQKERGHGIASAHFIRGVVKRSQEGVGIIAAHD